MHSPSSALADVPPSTPGTPSPWALNARGIRALQRGNAAAALAAFDEATAQYPGFAELHNNRGIVLQRLGRIEEAIAEFERALSIDGALTKTLAHLANGYAVLGRTHEALAAYERAVRLDPHFIEAHFGVYEVAQILGDRDLALRHQAEALSRQRIYVEEAPPAARRRTVLLLCSPGDWQANVPLEFVIDRSTNSIVKYFFVDGYPEPTAEELPPYDLVFNAVAQSDDTVPALLAVERFIARQNKPVINEPGMVLASSRYTVWQKLSRLDGCLVARIYRRKRQACRSGELGRFLRNAHIETPVLIRPVGSQAGHDLAKIDSVADVDAYLDRVPGDEFYVSEFIDYRSADGYYRKYRIMFVDGVPYACHLAISDNWMIHYYNTRMSENAWMRAEEETFLRDVRNVFPERLWPTFAEITKRMGLDYFGIDCTLTADGRVFVFEADPAMVVHLSDSKELFPYKHEYVPRILHALEALLDRKCEEGR